MKVFVFGRPGCGKSSAVRHIEKLARRRGLTLAHINDYAILREMFRADSECKQFCPTKEHNGFDVTDFSVLDVALKKAEQQARKCLRTADIAIIEFARNDYEAAFKQFSRAFLRHAYFLFIDTDMENCSQRIRNRVKNPIYPDDYFVSKHILECYYREQYVPTNLKVGSDNAEIRIKTIRNKGNRHAFEMQINRFFAEALRQEARLEPIKLALWDMAEKFSKWDTAEKLSQKKRQLYQQFSGIQHKMISGNLFSFLPSFRFHSKPNVSL